MLLHVKARPTVGAVDSGNGELREMPRMAYATSGRTDARDLRPGRQHRLMRVRGCRRTGGMSLIVPAAAASQSRIVG